MHKQALQAELYNEALEQSGIYPVTAVIMETKVSDALILLGEKSKNGKLPDFAPNFILAQWLSSRFLCLWRASLKRFSWSKYSKV